MENPLASLPSVSSLLDDPRVALQPHALAVELARQVVAEARAQILAGGPVPDDLAGLVAAGVEARRRPLLRRVINATGIVLHTNLGRAPLAPEAARAVAEVAAGYSNAELDLSSGKRGERLAGIEEKLCALTGAEAVVAVNNNAAAVLLAMTALAQGRQVIVSRGELVEIGGSFRVPDVIASGGALLREVGTTNRTTAGDYEAAVGPDTGMLLRVHRSNFRIEGFTTRPTRAELAAVARKHRLPLVEDLGSGALGGGMSIAGHTVIGEAADAVDAALADGVDLVCFSGDKLLGGPQAGIVVGRKELVARLRRHTLYRALRLDKLVLAALEGTLQVYREGRPEDVPGRALLARTAAECRAMAELMALRVPGARVEEDVGFSGGGALPALEVPTVVLVLPGGSPNDRLARLRAHEPPIIARVARDALIVDPRALLAGDLEAVTAALVALGAGS